VGRTTMRLGLCRAEHLLSAHYITFKSCNGYIISFVFFISLGFASIFAIRLVLVGRFLFVIFSFWDGVCYSICMIYLDTLDDFIW